MINIGDKVLVNSENLNGTVENIITSRRGNIICIIDVGNNLVRCSPNNLTVIKDPEPVEDNEQHFKDDETITISRKEFRELMVELFVKTETALFR